MRMTVFLTRKEGWGMPKRKRKPETEGDVLALIQAARRTSGVPPDISGMVERWTDAYEQGDRFRLGGVLLSGFITRTIEILNVWQKIASDSAYVGDWQEKMGRREDVDHIFWPVTVTVTPNETGVR